MVSQSVGPSVMAIACAGVLLSRATWRLTSEASQAAARLCKAAPPRRAHEICGVFAGPRRFFALTSSWRILQAGRW